MGGGVINLKASDRMLIDGEIKAYGTDTEVPGTGGGAGGSILLSAPHVSGRNDVVVHKTGQVAGTGEELVVESHQSTS